MRAAAGRISSVPRRRSSSRSTHGMRSRALAALPPTQREDLALLIGGYSYREIAATGGRARSRQQRQQAPDEGAAAPARRRERRVSSTGPRATGHPRPSRGGSLSSVPRAAYPSATRVTARCTAPLVCIAVRNASRWMSQQGARRERRHACRARPVEQQRDLAEPLLGTHAGPARRHRDGRSSRR